MAIFKTFNDVVQSMLENLRLVQPELDTKPGTVSRDVFVDSPSQQLANLYSLARTISSLQSLFSVSGSDLNKLGSNWGTSRASGSYSTGVAVFTTNNMDVDILIPRGSVINARNGVNFETLSDVVMQESSSNVYRATATRLRTDLNLASITDTFAVEVTVQALTSGLSGNIGRFSLISHNISGISNVTNLTAFSGGSNAESDDEYRTRILSVFAGSNTGTALGYTTAIGIVSGVLDSEIVVPGDPLLIRDGTQVSTDINGNLVVSDPGSGGKVDIYVLGTDLNSEIDSFIYTDQSGNNDPTDTDNDYILGQKGEDPTINASTRRVTLIDAGDLPNQPVENIISVSGSSSGSNFVQQYTDTDGTVKGNYTLVKDTGNFGGSPFGFDKLRWISDYIALAEEEVTKGIFNGYDALDFSDVEEIQNITQDYLVTNENSTTSTTNRSYVTLLHTPVRNVSRVVNLTTGERYTVESQNPDGTSGTLNTTGRIVISGSTLPVGTDTLQVDYTWVKPFDSKLDFDNLYDYNATRVAQDSVDWGFGNLVKDEPATVVADAYGTLTVTVSHPIYSVFNVNTFSTQAATVSNGALTLSSTVSNIIDIRRISDGAELYNTDSMDGSLSGTTSIVLPTDSLAENGDTATVRFNAVDLFSPDGYDLGTYESNVITLPEGATTNGKAVLVSYIANVSTLLSEQEISSLPIIKSGNKFLVGSSQTGEQPTSNILNTSSNFTHNLRRAASHIRTTLSSIPSEGRINIIGTTFNKVSDAIVTVTSSTGYRVDLKPAILSDLGVTTLPTSVKIARLVSCERVNINTSGVITSVDNVYDIVNYKMLDNAYDLDVALESSSLNSTSIDLPQTSDNVSGILNTGDQLRVTFYYVNTNDSEQLYFSRSGTQITNKVFADILRVTLGAGFKNASGVVTGNISLQNYNQPTINTTYSVDYDYTAPKENERITVTFNHNAVINSATNAVENVRPITADVLVKAAVAKTINVSIKIVLLSEYTDQSQTVQQDAVDAVTSFLNANSLGTTVDASDIVNTLYSVNGIDRVRIINFSVGSGGNVLSVTAEKNEYLKAGTVTVTVETR